jgi:hypothetical protein
MFETSVNRGTRINTEFLQLAEFHAIVQAYIMPFREKKLLGILVRYPLPSVRSRGGSVAIVTGYWLNRRGSISNGAKRFFSSPQH